MKKKGVVLHIGRRIVRSSAHSPKRKLGREDNEKTSGNSDGDDVCGLNGVCFTSTVNAHGSNGATWIVKQVGKGVSTKEVALGTADPVSAYPYDDLAGAPTLTGLLLSVAASLQMQSNQCAMAKKTGLVTR